MEEFPLFHQVMFLFLHDQIQELNGIAEAGADAVILLSNRLAAANESDEV